MKDDFDKRLKDHITGVFDNFEDASADAGWALLRKKYPEKKKRRGVIWLWMGSAAAILLLFLGIWAGRESMRLKSNKIAGKVNVEKSVLDTSANPESKEKIASVKIQNVTSTVLKLQGQSSKQASKNFIQQSVVAAKMSHRPQSVGANLQMSAPVQQSTVANNEPVKNQPNNVQQPVTANQNVTTNSAADTSAKKNIAQIEPKPVKPAVKSPFTDNDPVVKKDNAKSDNSKPVSFGVYEATYVNYASGSSNQVNVGVGFASDFHLSKNLKLSTGLAVNQNSLNFGNSLSPQTQLAYASAAKVNLVPGPVFGNLASTSYSSVLKSYNAQLTSLDVPLNLKYEFNPQKSSSFVSLGVSSGTFITESYNSQYTSTTATQTLNSNIGGFSSFYFAKTVDFSFGLGYPIGKNQLSVEPFVKYPLQGLGADQIRFGAGGLNLKFNFSNNKK